MSATGENIQETDTTIEGGGIVEWVESSTTISWDVDFEVSKVQTKVSILDRVFGNIDPGAEITRLDELRAANDNHREKEKAA